LKSASVNLVSVPIKYDSLLKSGIKYIIHVSDISSWKILPSCSCDVIN